MTARYKYPLNRYVINLLCTQYSETNVMHFLFSLLRMKGLYMFRAFLSHPQEKLQKRHLVYCVSVMSAGWWYRFNPGGASS
jgi:hypothetical protein